MFIASHYKGRSKRATFDIVTDGLQTDWYKTFFVIVTTFETNENHSMRVVTKDNSSENFNKHPTKKAMAEFFFHKISGLDIYKTRMGSKTLFNFVKKRIGH